MVEACVGMVEACAGMVEACVGMVEACVGMVEACAGRLAEGCHKNQRNLFCNCIFKLKNSAPVEGLRF